MNSTFVTTSPEGDVGTIEGEISRHEIKVQMLEGDIRVLQSQIDAKIGEIARRKDIIRKLKS